MDIWAAASTLSELFMANILSGVDHIALRKYPVSQRASKKWVRRTATDVE
jgi:hypothetical protein